MKLTKNFVSAQLQQHYAGGLVSAGVIIKITLAVILQPILTYLTGIDYRQVMQVPTFVVLFPLPGLIIMGHCTTS